MIKNVILMLPLLLLPAGPAGAQQQLALDWDQARKLAIQNNPSVKAARASMEQAGYNYLAELNVYMPKISLSNGVSRGRGDNSSSWSASVRATEDLLNLGNTSGVKLSRIAREKAEADYLSASASARQTLGGAFADLLFAQKGLEVQKKILSIRVENARLIRLKYESGMESKGNALYTEALAENSAVSVKKAGRQAATAQRALIEAIGLEGSVEVKANGDIGVPAFVLDEARLKRALEKSPAIVSAKKTLEAAKERTGSARYDGYPTLSASQGYSWSGASEFPGKPDWSLGLSLNLPIFSGGPTRYFNALSAAKSSQAAAEERFKAARISLSASLRSGYDDYLSAAETAQAGVSLLNANEERFKEARIKYMAGKISFIDLENVEQNFVDSDLNQLNFARAAHSRKLALEQLLGVGIEE